MSDRTEKEKKEKKDSNDSKSQAAKHTWTLPPADELMWQGQTIQNGEQIIFGQVWPNVSPQVQGLQFRQSIFWSALLGVDNGAHVLRRDSSRTPTKLLSSAVIDVTMLLISVLGPLNQVVVARFTEEELVAMFIIPKQRRC